MSTYVMVSAEERFWVKVKKTRSCWLWTAHSNDRGRGQFWLNGRNEAAPRVAWWITYGEFDTSTLFVLHKCDNPLCVNPKHLFLGTIADNQRDMVQKGRSMRGERNGNRKLTVAQVRRLRRISIPRGALTKVAAQFGIDVSQVENIRFRRQWRHA